MELTQPGGNLLINSFQLPHNVDTLALPLFKTLVPLPPKTLAPQLLPSLPLSPSSMEFWGVEVKAGKPIKADPGANHVIHLSQATLGESKNKAESVTLHVNADGQKLVLGTLSHQNFPQLSFDLVFDQEFELSHNWKNGSVYFLGYKTFVPDEGYPFLSSS
ncbi:Nucleoplasmin-like domain - like 3 [Theobroma cacao]|nr:Nucleoplasmin-like domain - like 3 [Theobroma cacao]